MAHSHSIVQVKTRRDRRDFLKVPAFVYSNDEFYVQQPNAIERSRIGAENPYFEHGQAALFLARDDKGKPVGRISAQMEIPAVRNDLSTTDRKGYFGFLEANDEAILRGLIKAAEKWLVEREVKEMSGPYSFSINEEAGLLVEGFDSPPYMLMNYAQSWYREAVENLGFVKAKDLLAFEFPIGPEISRRGKKMAMKCAGFPNLVERPLNKSQFDAEIKTVAALFNDAWAQNWGFIPMTETDIAHMAKSLKPVLPPELVRMIEIDGKPAAMMVTLPDVNEAFAGLNGRLLPFNWAKILWRLKVRKPSRARVILMGVASEWRSDFRGACMAALLVDRTYDQLCKWGYHHMEMSWILEDNDTMIRLIKIFEGNPYKRYRLYQKTLS